MIRELTIEEMDQIYHTHLVQDFPASEVKPMSNIRVGFEEGRYFAYGMFADKDTLEHLKAYGFFIKSRVSETFLLDYLAVVRGQRNAGTGSKFLQELQKMCERSHKNLVLEVENPMYAQDEETKEYRETRIRFYERNHMVVSEVSCNFYENEYLILYGKNSEYKCPLQAEILRIYNDFFGEDFVKKHVIFH